MSSRTRTAVQRIYAIFTIKHGSAIFSKLRRMFEQLFVIIYPSWWVFYLTPHACIVWIFKSMNTMIERASCTHVAVENIFNSIPLAIKFNKSVFGLKRRDMSHLVCGERPATYDTQCSCHIHGDIRTNKVKQNRWRDVNVHHVAQCHRTHWMYLYLVSQHIFCWFEIQRNTAVAVRNNGIGTWNVSTIQRPVIRIVTRIIRVISTPYYLCILLAELPN